MKRWQAFELGSRRGIGAAGRRLGERFVNSVEYDLRVGGLSRVFGHMMDTDLTFATRGKCLNAGTCNRRGIGAAGRRLGTRLAMSVEYDSRVEGGGGGKPSFWTYDECRLDICDRGKRSDGGLCNRRGIGAAGRRLGTRLANSVECDLRVEDGWGGEPSLWTYDGYRLAII